MKKMVSALAIAAGLAAGSAFAADLPSRKGPPEFLPPPVFSWTGFYGGLNIGYGWSEDDDNNNFGFGFGFNNNDHLDGVVGGGQVGFNYQFTPLFVVGFESDFQGTGISSHDSGFLNIGRSINWFGTVRGRVGVTPILDGRLLIYGTGGFAYGDVEHFLNGFRDTQTGWTAGGGVEYAFLPNWSAKVEYLFTELNNDDDGGFVGFGGPQRTRFHTVRAGVNYHVNLFGPSPVLAGY